MPAKLVRTPPLPTTGSFTPLCKLTVECSSSYYAHVADTARLPAALYTFIPMPTMALAGAI